MRRFELFFMVFQVPIDFLAVLLAAIFAYYLRFTDFALGLKPVLFNLSLSEYIGIASLPAFLSIIFFAFAGLYTPKQNRKLASDIPRIFFGTASTLAVLALYVMFTQQLFDSRFLVAASFIFSFVFVSLGRFILWLIRRVFFKMGIGQKRVVLIGDSALCNDLIRTFDEKPGFGSLVVGTFERFTPQLEKSLQKLFPLDEIIFMSPRAHEKEALLALEFAQDHHIIFKYSADLFAALSANTQMYPVGSIPIVELQRTRLNGWGSVIKRLFDIVMSSVMIVILSPLMALTAFIIFFETGSPIIYRNERAGQHEKNFFTLKFRSMYKKDCTGEQFGKNGAEAEQREKELIKKQSIKDGPIYKIANDPRITPFGNFIRRVSIDELPQFFNVLCGEMSIVGPRPHQPREIAKYEKEHRKVFTLKPGITGLAQISGRSDLSFEEENRLDVFYIEKWSLWLDLVIFIKTPFILLRKRKAL